jgi:outer membrane biosynthesis protein TonB
MGDRFVSTTKADFDLCSTCMLSEAGQKLEPEHKFKKVAAFDALLDCLRQGGGVDAFFAGGDKEEAAAPAPAAHQATCDVCSQTIVGSRFKSLAEHDYDECAPCRAKSSKPADEFFELKDPAVRTIPDEARAAFAARKQAAEKAKEAEKEKAEKAKEAPRLVQPKPIAVEQPKPVVVEQPKPVAPPAEPERQPSSFEVNLQTLESMGFSDRKRNIATLVSFSFS